MKKIWIMLLALVMLLCAGCNEETVETYPTETQPLPTETVTQPTETEPPVPETVEATVKADGVPTVLLTLNRDDVVELVGEFDEDHYIVKTQEKYGLVEKCLLRTADQEPYAPWTGYAFHGAAVYDNLRLQGEAVQTLTLNQTVEVVEDLGFCWLVRWQDALCFMRPGSLSVSFIKYTGGNTGGADGGDIELNASRFDLLAAVPQEGAVTGQATVLADGTELVLCYLNWGDAIQVITEEGFAEPREGFLAVYMEDMVGYVPAWLVRQAGEEAYTAWDGYANYNTVVYENFYLLGEAAAEPVVNTGIHVIEELDTCYMVQVGEVTGYVAKDLVSVNKIHINTGGGDTGGEWSPPAM